MITFIDLFFSPQGPPAATIVARLQRLKGVSSVMGEHDLMFQWKSTQEFDDQMRAIHAALEGTHVRYRVFTVEDSYQSRDPVPWIRPIETGPTHHPAVPEDEPSE